MASALALLTGKIVCPQIIRNITHSAGYEGRAIMGGKNLLQPSE